MLRRHGQGVIQDDVQGQIPRMAPDHGQRHGQARGRTGKDKQGGLRVHLALQRFRQGDVHLYGFAAFGRGLFRRGRFLRRRRPTSLQADLRIIDELLYPLLRLLLAAQLRYQSLPVVDGRLVITPLIGRHAGKPQRGGIFGFDLQGPFNERARLALEAAAVGHGQGVSITDHDHRLVTQFLVQTLHDVDRLIVTAHDDVGASQHQPAVYVVRVGLQALLQPVHHFIDGSGRGAMAGCRIGTAQIHIQGQGSGGEQHRDQGCRPAACRLRRRRRGGLLFRDFLQQGSLKFMPDLFRLLLRQQAIILLRRQFLQLILVYTEVQAVIIAGLLPAGRAQQRPRQHQQD